MVVKRGSGVDRVEMTGPRRPHLVGMDGLRALAAAGVLVTHTAELSIARGTGGALGTLAGYGGQGLTLFFAISGFLLFLPFVASLLEERPFPSVRKYFVSRGLRIYPAYLVIFFVVNFGFGAVNRKGTINLYPHGGDVGRITDWHVLLPNLLLVQSYFPHTFGTGIGPAWSLTAELTFYLLLPLLALLAFRLSKRFAKSLALMVIPVLLIVVGLTTSTALLAGRAGMSASQAYAAQWGHNWTSVISRSLLAQADLFGYGMLGAIGFEVCRQRDANLSGRIRSAGLIGVAAATALALKEGGAYTSHLVGICAGVLILLVVLPSQTSQPANALARMFDFGPIRYLGLISYSVYLWHYPIIDLLLAHGHLARHGSVGLAEDCLIVLAVVVVLASLSFYTIERPALNLRNRIAFRKARHRAARSRANERSFVPF